MKANQDYWTPSTNFQQGAEGVFAATLDYGYPLVDVLNAFAVVGITPLSEIFVEDIAVSLVSQGKRYKVNAVVTIMDTNDTPIADATVYITWSGVVSGTDSGITAGRHRDLCISYGQGSLPYYHYGRQRHPRHPDLQFRAQQGNIGYYPLRLEAGR